MERLFLWTDTKRSKSWWRFILSRRSHSNFLSTTLETVLFQDFFFRQFYILCWPSRLKLKPSRLKTISVRVLEGKCCDFLEHKFQSLSTFWISVEDIECHSSHPYSADVIGIVFISKPIVIELIFPRLFNLVKKTKGPLHYWRSFLFSTNLLSLSWSI